MKRRFRHYDYFGIHTPLFGFRIQGPWRFHRWWPFSSREEYIEELEEYKQALEEELRAVEGGKERGVALSPTSRTIPSS